jgi:hypothetical protein
MKLLLFALIAQTALSQVGFGCFYYFKDDFLIYNVKNVNSAELAY